MGSGDVVNDDMENQPQRYALGTARGKITVSTEPPRFQHLGSVNGSAQVWLSCRCGVTIIVPLYAHDEPGEGLYDVPEGWSVWIDRGGPRVRCPEHKAQ